MSIHSEVIFCVNTACYEMQANALIRDLHQYLEVEDYDFIYVVYGQYYDFARANYEAGLDQGRVESAKSKSWEEIYSNAIDNDVVYELLFMSTRGSTIFQSLLASIPSEIRNGFCPSQPLLRIGRHEVVGLQTIDSTVTQQTNFSLALTGRSTPYDHDTFHEHFIGNSEVKSLLSVFEKHTKIEIVYYYDV